MKITLLGTGTSQGIPVMGCGCAVCASSNSKDNRLRTSVLIQTETAALVIDCGPDFRQQMLRERVQNLDAVLLTHEHQDHVAGLDELRSYIFKNKRPMPIYAEKNVLSRVKTLIPYAFSEHTYPGAPSFELCEIGPGELEIAGLSLIAIRAMHGNLSILGFRINSFAYFTDVNFLAEESIAALQNLDVLVIDALHHKSHHSHFNLKEALEAITEIAPQKAYLTHLSHNMGLHDVVETILPENVFLAFDGLQFSF